MHDRVIDYGQIASFPLDETVRAIRGWTTAQERQFNQWYAAKAYRGIGEIVDLGSMTGSSAAALACGLTENTAANGRKVHAYDQFVKQWRTIPGEPLEAVEKGGDFLDIFIGNVAPWNDRIEIHRGDVSEIGWRGGPIEYLFVDLMKSWATAEFIVQTFFGSLVAHESLVVQQDFFHYYTPWVHLVMHRLRDFFAPVLEIPDSCSYVFRTTETPSAVACRGAVDFSDISVAEVDEVFEHAESLVSVNSLGPLKAAKAMFFYHYAHMKAGPGTSDGSFDHWMTLAVDTYRRIAPSFQSNRDVVRTGHCLLPFLDPKRPGSVRLVAPTPIWMNVLAMNGAKARLDLADGGGLRVVIDNSNDGPAWQVQGRCSSFGVTEGQMYHVSLRGRADKPRNMIARVAMVHEPWAGLGCYLPIALGTGWRSFGFTFKATSTESAARLDLLLGESDTPVELQFAHVRPATGWMLSAGDDRDAVLTFPPAEDVAPAPRGEIAPVSFEVMRIDVGQQSQPEPWRVRLVATPRPVRPDAEYEVRFKARAEGPREMTASLRDARTGEHLGLPAKVALTNSWQAFTHRFKAKAAADQASFGFELGGSDTAVEIADAEMSEAGGRAASMQ